MKLNNQKCQNAKPDNKLKKLFDGVCCKSGGRDVEMRRDIG